MSDERRTVGGRTLSLSSLDKMFFEEAGLTKRDLVDYYERIADRCLPYARDRPMSLQRFPDGVGENGFFQKHVPDYFPEWIDRVELDKEDGTVTHVVANDAATLVYLANQGMVTPHVGLSRTDRVRRPDRLIFDLDPSTDDFGEVQFAARAVRELAEEIELEAFVMTSGSRGLHVYVPCIRELEFSEAREVAKSMASVLATRYPNRLTTEQRKNKRSDRVFLDVLRNAYGQTTVLPFGVRARPTAPVATPLDWEEALDAGLGPRDYTIENIFRRLSQKQDPWKAMGEVRQSLRGARTRLESLTADSDDQ